MQVTQHHKDEMQYLLNALRSLDVQKCKLIATWLSEHIKMLENHNGIYNKSIQQLSLSSRTQKVLKRNNIDTIGSLIQRASNWDNIRILKGAGEKVLNELDQKIKQVLKGETIR